MLKFLRPLGIFLGSQLAVLCVWVFLPSLGERLALLLFLVPGADLWGWTWAVSSARFLIIVLMEILILWKTGRAILDAK
jgi:hypothetical protein